MRTQREIEPFIQRAKELDDPPGPQSTASVRCLGERLKKPIYWSGHQWAVTAFGIEARDGKYPIAKNRLWEEEDVYGWVRHMEEKGWVDMPDFVEALRIARQRFAPKPS
jgi:hypothetical protein